MAGKEKNHAPRLAGVIGWPIGHSLSPAIHQYWARRAGLNAHYIPIAVEPTYESFARAIDALRTLGFAGVNVTLPHKEHALRYADAASENARQAGAANMLTLADHAYADNSDIIGFANALRSVRDKAGNAALILGAGGAARGVILALKQLGYNDILIANRTREKAEALAATFGLAVTDWTARENGLEKLDLLVNTTSLGMTGEPALEMNLDGLSADAVVADIVYSPLKTELLKSAKARGNPVVDGLAMLMHQAAPGFRNWFGADAVVDEDLRAILVDALEKRGRL